MLLKLCTLINDFCMTIRINDYLLWYIPRKFV